MTLKMCSRNTTEKPVQFYVQNFPSFSFPNHIIVKKFIDCKVLGSNLAQKM